MFSHNNFNYKTQPDYEPHLQHIRIEYNEVDHDETIAQYFDVL